MKYSLVLKPGIRSGLKRLLVLGAWLAVAGGLAGAAFIFSFYTAMRWEMQSTQVVVPGLAGLTLEDAGSVARPAGLVLQVVDERNDPRVPSGKVLEQMPPAGSSVRRGRKVKLILSLGDRVLQVPEIVGHASRAVAIELRQGGFAPGDEARVHSWDLETGQVLAQVPPSGTAAVPNSRVHRLVSDGPPSLAWVMPDLSGRTLAQVERWIAAKGFRRGVVRKVSSRDGVRGTVVAQLPLAGYPIRARDIVELAVAD